MPVPYRQIRIDRRDELGAERCLEPFGFVTLVTRRFQEVARDAEHAVDRENVALDAIVESEEKIKGLKKKIGNVDNRLKNIEKKVSDELPDILTKQLRAGRAHHVAITHALSL